MEKTSKKQSNSGNIQYGAPVVIHETSKSRQVLIPFFIPRSQKTELAIKIQTFTKSPPPFNWAEKEEKSISLNGSASLNLLAALKAHLLTANVDDEGEFIMLKLNGQNSDIENFDAETISKALAGVISNKEIVNHLMTKDLSNEMILAFKSAIRLREMQSACSELRDYLNNNVVDEKTFQDWCNKHDWIFGNAYLVKDEVRSISEGDKTDMLLPTVISGYRDIIELKKPDELVLNWDTAHKNYYFSSAVSKAIGQCHRYLDVFQEVAKNGLRDSPEIMAYHPRAILIIGRSNGWGQNEYRALHGLNSRFVNITIMTYDQLLAQGERLIEILSGNLPENDNTEEIDLPF